MINFTKRFLLLFVVTLFFLEGNLEAQGAYPVLDNLAENGISNDAKLLGALDNRLVYFDESNDEYILWVSDGTAEGTVQISPEDQTEISLIGSTSNAWYFEEIRGENSHLSVLSSGSNELVSLLTTTKSIYHPTLWGDDLYYAIKVDGSNDEDLMKIDISTGTTTKLFTSDFGGIVGIGGTDNDLFFIASMDDGKMLGKSDGTAANTTTFHKLYDGGSEFGKEVYMKSDGQKMYFFYHPTNEPYTLFVSDGTSEGTKMLEVYDYPAFGAPDRNFVFANNRMFFILREEGAPSGTTYEMHATDGTVAGTVKLNEESYYSNPRALTVFNNKVYFSYQDGNWNRGMKSTDGTLSGTEVVLTPYTSSDGVGGIYDVNVYNNQLVLSGYSSENGREIFVSDGTAEGTSLLVDVNQGEEGSNPGEYMQVGDLLFFMATTNEINQLWVFDPDYQPTAVVNPKLIHANKIYPNPLINHSELTIDLKLTTIPKRALILIHDMYGKQVLQKKLEVGTNRLKETIDLGNLAAGNYLLSVYIDNEIALTHKLTSF